MCLIDVFTVKFYDEIPVMVWLAYTILMQGIWIFWSHRGGNKSGDRLSRSVRKDAFVRVSGFC